MKSFEFKNGNYIYVKYKSGLDFKRIILKTWVKIDSTFRANRGVIVSRFQASGYGFAINNGWYPSGHMGFTAHINGGYRHASCDMSTIKDGWHCLTGVFDGYDISFYVDGKLMDKKLVSRNLSYLSYISNALFIGRDVATGENPDVDVYNGLINGVAVFDYDKCDNIDYIISRNMTKFNAMTPGLEICVIADDDTILKDVSKNNLAVNAVNGLLSLDAPNIFLTLIKLDTNIYVSINPECYVEGGFIPLRFEDLTLSKMEQYGFYVEDLCNPITVNGETFLPIDKLPEQFNLYTITKEELQ